MNRRRTIPALLASALVLGLGIAAAVGVFDGGDPGSGRTVATTGLAPISSGGGDHTQPPPLALKSRVLGHPHVSARIRTHPRLQPRGGGRNTTFTLAFRLRKNLGPHGHTWPYYGVIVSPLARHPHRGCYGFGRYVMKGRQGQIARVTIHPRGRPWCAGTYQASVYLTGRPYCRPGRACSTASYPATPTGWVYFNVR